MKQTTKELNKYFAMIDEGTDYYAQDYTEASLKELFEMEGNDGDYPEELKETLLNMFLETYK